MKLLQWTASLLFVASAINNSNTSAQELSLDVALAHKESVNAEPFAISPTGDKIAFSIRAKKVDWGRLAGDSGIPTSWVGLQVRVSDVSKEDANEQPVCLDQLGSSATSWSPTWSPNGEQLAFYSDSGGRPQLWVWDSKSEACFKPIEREILSSFMHGFAPAWSRDGESVIVPLKPDREGATGVVYTPDGPVNLDDSGATAEFRANDVRVLRSKALKMRLGASTKDVSLSAGTPNPDLVLVNLETGSSRTIVPMDASVRPSTHFRISPSGLWISYFSTGYFEEGATFGEQKHDIVVAPVNGSASPVRVAAGLGEYETYFEGEYRWHPTKDVLVYVKDKRAFVVEVSPGGPAEPVEISAEYGAIHNRIIHFDADTDSVILGIESQESDEPVVAVAFGDEPGALAKFSLSGQGAPKVYRHDPSRFRVKHVVTENTRGLWKNDRNRSFVLARDEQTGESVFLEFAERNSSLEEVSRFRGRTSFLQASKSGLFAVYENFEVMQRIHRFDRRLMPGSAIASGRSGVLEQDFGEIRRFNTIVPLHDGRLKSVRSAVVLPTDHKPSSPPPAIVWFYPGLFLDEDLERFGGESMMGPASIFTTRGFAVLFVSTPASGYENNPQHITNELIDVIMPQIYNASALDLVDVNRLALRGQSFGGYGTAAILSRTNLFRAAIASAGIYNLTLPGESQSQQGDLADDPWKNTRHYVENSPYFNAHKIRTPLLILHGTEDQNIEQVTDFFHALDFLNGEVEFVVYEGGGHVAEQNKIEHAKDAVERMLEFLDRNLGD